MQPHSIPRIHRISVPTPFRVGAVNCYLIEAERLTLVDAGPNTAPALAALEQGIALAGHSVEAIDLLVVTHQHHDHAGLAAAVHERSGATVAGHIDLGGLLGDVDASLERDDQFALRIMRRYGIDPRDADYLYSVSRTHRGYTASVEVDLLIEDGDFIDLGDAVLQAFHRPGHSPTDIVLRERETRRGLVGDHLIGHISSNPVLHAPLAGCLDAVPRASPLAAYLASLEKTEELGIDVGLPGHGDVVDDLNSLIRHRIESHRERKEEIAARIGAGLITAPLLIGDLWHNLPRDQIFLALSEVLGHTDILVAEGRLAEHEESGVVQFVSRVE